MELKGPFKLTNGETYDVQISHVYTPTYFWAFLKTDASRLKKLTQELKQFYSKHKDNKYEFKNPNKEDLVAARYNNGSYWYRAKLISINQQKDLFTVFYVDFGNIEKLPKESIKLLDKQFTLDEAFAIPFTLFNVYPKSNDDWSSKQRELFKQITRNLECKAKIIINNEWPIYFCEIYEYGSNRPLSNVLHTENIAREASLVEVSGAYSNEIQCNLKSIGLNLNIYSNESASYVPIRFDLENEHQLVENNVDYLKDIKMKRVQDYVKSCTEVHEDFENLSQDLSGFDGLNSTKFVEDLIDFDENEIFNTQAILKKIPTSLSFSLPTNLDLISQPLSKNEKKFIIGQNRVNQFEGIRCVLPEDTFSIKLSRLECTVTLKSIQDMLNQLRIEYYDLKSIKKTGESYQSFSFRAPCYQEDKIFDASIWPYGIKVEKYFD